jgi:hypothetical protein
MAIEKLEIENRNKKIKPEPIHRLTTTKTAKNSDQTRPHTQHTEPEHMYLKLRTPLTPSVEKIVNLLWFKYVHKPTNINVIFSQLFSQCGS